MNKNLKKTKTLNWSSSLEDLLGKASQKSYDKLIQAGYTTLLDLLWIFPLKIIELPPIRSFKYLQEDSIFIGRAKVLNVQARPNFRARGKGKAMLYNIMVHVQDIFSDQVITLKWFNSYGSITSKISKATYIEFMGDVSVFNGQFQMANPEFHVLETTNDPSVYVEISNELKIQYPTVNSVSGVIIKKFIDKIPNSLWKEIPETLPKNLITQKNFLSLADSFQVLHAKIKPDAELTSKAHDRLIYEEFFIDQLKIYLRRQHFKKPIASKFDISDSEYQKIIALYSYELTNDQTKSLNDIKKDFKSGHPMMRLIQGDVGCGKTTVAMISAMIVIANNAQVALMAPTEALAIQHFNSAQELFGEDTINIKLLLGSTSAKEKKIINEKLFNGEIDLVIGTHSLFQDSVQFKNLGLAIIDEQHKFGVEQRIKLTNKGNGTHCLIMSATPIPRSLSLTQYGDLDISTIRTMPSNRKGHKTRIVTPETYSQYLNFINTRLSLKEQVYIVVAAIDESAEQDFHNLTEVLERYKQYFPHHKVEGLHGRMKSDEKSLIFSKFGKHEIDILVSTSVIEVGINVLNATVMAILNPERFGLSSLHQLRGRVGRGEKPGFCFLVNDKQISSLSMERLRVIESNTDGFKIAEEDLKIRGEGDLFGTEQSGSHSQKRMANIILHADILYQAKIDTEDLIKMNNPEILALLSKLAIDAKVYLTV